MPPPPGRRLGGFALRCAPSLLVYDVKQKRFHSAIFGAVRRIDQDNNARK